MIQLSLRGLAVAAVATVAATLIPASAAADTRLDQAMDNL